MSVVNPYKLPDVLPSFLPKVLSYWMELRRGQAKIPFADDISRTALSDCENDLVLIDVFNKPFRYRFGLVGAQIAEAYGSDIAGIFLDELDPRPPLDLVHSQASAAAEMCEPSFYKTKTYARLMLPAWGDGHVSALLGAIAAAE
jgi:hypothetical protein